MLACVDLPLYSFDNFSLSPTSFDTAPLGEPLFSRLPPAGFSFVASLSRADICPVCSLLVVFNSDSSSLCVFVIASSCVCSDSCLSVIDFTISSCSTFSYCFVIHVLINVFFFILYIVYGRFKLVVVWLRFHCSNVIFRRCTTYSWRILVC